MKKELPNILCWYRISYSLIIAIFIPKGTGVAILFSLAFITDLLDGYLYRKLDEKPDHWFNRLPISPDPIADFIFGLAGLIYASRRGGFKPVIVLVIAAYCILINIAFNLSSEGVLRRVIANLLTYGFYLVMIISNYLVWKFASPKSLAGFIASEIVFYCVYFLVRDKRRIVR